MKVSHFLMVVRRILETSSPEAKAKVVEDFRNVAPSLRGTGDFDEIEHLVEEEFTKHGFRKEKP